MDRRMTKQTECAHLNFRSRSDVYRLSEVEGGPITSYTVDLHIECAECGLPFRFLGLQAGAHFSEPRVSVDATELRAPIEPAYTVEILGKPLVSGRA